MMTAQPLTVDLDTPVRDANGLMKQREIPHLPVVDHAGRLMGILADRDVSHAGFIPALAESLAWDPRRLQTPR